jgi:hypothetical protein
MVGVLLAGVACGARTEPLDGASVPARVDAGEATDGEGTAQSDGAPSPNPDGALDGPIDAPPDGSTRDAVADAATLVDTGCGPGTCNGCCLKDGTCILPDEVSAAFCGSGGLACIACPAGITCGIDTSDGTRVCAHFF